MNDLKSKQNQAIVFYDGCCVLCHWSTRFLKNHNKDNKFRFVMLQSDEAIILLDSFSLKPTLGGVLLIDENRLYAKSDAILNALKYLNKPWRWLSWIRVIPLKFRDKVYDIVARYRYRMFGKKNTCTSVEY